MKNTAISLLKSCALFATFVLASCTNTTEDTSESTKTKPKVTQQPKAEIVDDYLNGWLQEEYANESEKANEFFARVFKANLARNPEMQTYLGIKDDYSKWDDISDEKSQADLAIKKQNLAKIKQYINYGALDAQTKVSYRLFVDSIEQDIKDFKYRFHNYPINQMFGIQSGMPSFMINMHRISTEQDAKDYITRLDTVDSKFTTVIKNLKHRQELGIVAPKFVYPYVISDSKNVITGQPFDDSEKDSILLADFKKKVEALEIEDSSKEALIAQANAALLSSVLPAYQQLISVTEELQKIATDDAGAWKFPNGEEFYKAALKKTTTTDLSANEIHETGLKEVARIHDEMRKIMNKVEFEGDLQQFFEFMRTDKRFYYENTEADRAKYLAANVKIIESMKSKLDLLFLRKPKADIVVKQVEKFRGKSAGKAFYNSPSIDGSRPGIYYANLYNMAEMPLYQMEALAHHEGIPGHHMQLAIAQELEGLPKFRKFGRYTAYTEGWGLYSEFLPKEIGAYSDPYSDFGRLAMELWRSCRLVVDTGIHAKKWSREQGIEYYTKNTPNAKEEAIKMVERHIVMPSQATAYKIGMMKIMALKDKAQTQLGSAFDIRQFHDVVLKNGPLPLTVLEEFVDEWIAEKRASQHPPK